MVARLEAPLTALAMRDAWGSSAFWRSKRARPLASRSFIRSRAVLPVVPMRISKGPSKRVEKPRSASSIWWEETPKSMSTPVNFPCASKAL